MRDPDIAYAVEDKSIKGPWRFELFDSAYGSLGYQTKEYIERYAIKVKVHPKTPFVSPHQHMADSAAKTVLPTDPQERKDMPVVTGCLDYFPNALAYISKISKHGNDQHNPGQALHWAREKSTDHADTCVRHLMERGSFDVDGTRHSGKAAWRALALLQQELEDAGAPMSRASKLEPRVVGIDMNIKIGGTD